MSGLTRTWAPNSLAASRLRLVPFRPCDICEASRRIAGLRLVAVRIRSQHAGPWHPTEHPLKGLVKKVKHEIKDLWWYKKTLYNTVYFLSRPLRWIRMYKAWKAKRLPKTTDSVVIAVRNDDDYFMHPVDSRVLASERGWKLENLKGHHDDLWMNPKPYVDMLKEAIRTNK